METWPFFSEFFKMYYYYCIIDLTSSSGYEQRSIEVTWREILGSCMQSYLDIASILGCIIGDLGPCKQEHIFVFTRSDGLDTRYMYDLESITVYLGQIFKYRITKSKCCIEDKELFRTYFTVSSTPRKSSFPLSCRGISSSSSISIMCRLRNKRFGR